MLKSSFNNWKWQLANRITNPAQLAGIISLTDDEAASFDGIPLSFAVTPYYAQLLTHPSLRRTVIPTRSEKRFGEGELEDPLGEENHRVAPHLIHTYPDKVLFLATTFCSTYCRYCTRSRIVGKADAHKIENETPGSVYEQDFRYIENHPEIRDVLISGGDPLTLTDSVLDALLARIRAVPHVKIIRIGSKVPAVLPMRITPELCTILRKHGVCLSLHFTHPVELTEETQAACRQLADSGILMVSQTVLLKGVNDDSETLKELFYGLITINIKPYYLLQCDPVRGSAQFRTPVKKGIELIQSLHGHCSGLTVPQYVIDAPGGGGKIPLLSESQFRRDGNEIVLINYQGKKYRYPDPR